MMPPACSISRRRRGRRGMMLVVIMALLMVFALIGAAFSYIVVAEQRAARNAFIRFRALSLARDGEAYAIARLRSLAAARHYESEQEGGWAFNSRFTSGGRRVGPVGDPETYLEYLRRYAENPTLNDDPSKVIVSFSRAGSTNTAGIPDGSWVDRNGDGVASDDERDEALNPRVGDSKRRVLDGVSYIVSEGIDRRSFPGRPMAGTFKPLGDRARLKVLDTNAQLNINDYRGQQLSYILQVLGKEIGAVLGVERKNPFPKEIADEIARYKQDNLDRLDSKAELRRFFDDEKLYQFTMDLIAVKSWPLFTSGVTGTRPDFTAARNPRLGRRLETPNSPPPRAEDDKQPFSDIATGHREGTGERGRDGNAETQPSGGRGLRSPINVNTVSKPVLTAMIAGLEAEARFFYFPDRKILVENDRSLNGVLQYARGTTDYAQQPIIDRGSPFDESDAAMANVSLVRNAAIYQMVPVGPLGYGIRPPWKDVAGGDRAMNPWYEGQHASNLAQLIIDEREKNGPYKSWMDFDYRICHQHLMGFGLGSPQIQSADLVNTQRPGRSAELPTSLAAMPAGSGGGSRALIPDPGDVTHPVSGKNASNSYSAQEFDAWYWRACVDMIRANFNPNGYLNKTNPDAAYYTTVDTTDLSYSTAPFCFSSMGVYEVVSQGELVSDGVVVSATAPRGGEVVMARRTFRSIVEVYRVLEHTTQQDFLSYIDVQAFAPGARTSASGGAKTVTNPVVHTAFGTQSHPNSVNLGIFDYASQLITDDQRRGSPAGLKDDDGKANSSVILYDGYFSRSAADNRFGYVGLYPQDRTPNTHMRANPEALNFHSVYNISLEALPRKNESFGNRAPGAGFRPQSVGPNEDLADGWNSATPDPLRKNTDTWKGYEEAAQRSSMDAAQRATLRPDGVLLRGWHLNPMYGLQGGAQKSYTYGLRGNQRVSRLAFLRYRAGAIGDSAFAPINAQNPDDSKQTLPGAGQKDPVTGIYIEPMVREVGAPPTGEGGTQGTNEQHTLLQDTRQRLTNFPYYQGWIDFWIKWELPPQGVSGKPACAGEVDPGSGNFSGLLGATSYGRFAMNPGDKNGFGVPYDALGKDSDFEGVQFFIFKEPGGVLRVTQLYFTEAFTVETRNPATQNGVPVPAQYKELGNRNRITGKDKGSGKGDGTEKIEFDDLVATNDIGSGPDDFGPSYARMDSYVDLSELPSGAGVDLITHNWYRFTLRYLSNARYRSGSALTLNAEPHQLFIDGRKVPMTFKAPALDASNAVNTGEVTDASGNLRPFSWSGATTYYFQRTATRLLEVDPEDKLTIGGVFRRQHPDRLRAAKNITDISPVFLFDTNIVAPANATIDDVRISGSLSAVFGNDGTFNEGEYTAYSRFEKRGQPGTGGAPVTRGMYENAFLASRTSPAGNDVYTFPIRVGSLTWTEYRPTWDSYARKRMDVSDTVYAAAPQVILGFEVIQDATQAAADGAAVQHIPSAFTSTDRSSLNYWLAGGYAVEQVAGAPVFIRNQFSGAGGGTVGLFKYQAFFIVPGGSEIKVLNTTPILDDVRLTLLTPPQRIYSEETFQ